jgi:hypothetical protein
LAIVKGVPGSVIDYQLTFQTKIKQQKNKTPHSKINCLNSKLLYESSQPTSTGRVSDENQNAKAVPYIVGQTLSLTVK